MITALGFQLTLEFRSKGAKVQQDHESWQLLLLERKLDKSLELTLLKS